MYIEQETNGWYLVECTTPSGREIVARIKSDDEEIKYTTSSMRDVRWMLSSKSRCFTIDFIFIDEVRWCFCGLREPICQEDDIPSMLDDAFAQIRDRYVNEYTRFFGKEPVCQSGTVVLGGKDA